MTERLPPCLASVAPAAAEAMRARAAGWRRVMQGINDTRALAVLEEMAAELEQRADAMETALALPAA